MQFGCADMPSINVFVKVQDEEQKPVQGADVRIAFRGVEGGSVKSGLSDESGSIELSGRSNLEVVVTVAKNGYYQSELESMVHRRVNETKKFETFDPEFEIVLRDVRNPIPMKAKKVSTLIPTKNVPLGYDLMVGDWVDPHGEGVIPDLIFEVSGYFNSSNDTESLLKIGFQNEGDGLNEFSSELKQSVFQSPYQVPASNYISEKSWRIIRKSDSKEAVRIYEYEPDKHYFFRIRTEVDKDGQLRSAYYGKIYGDIQFGGAASREGYFLKFTYYLNPNLLDRNIEYAIGQSLLEGLESEHQAVLP